MRRTGDPRWRVYLGYQGLTGILARAAPLRIYRACGFSNGTRCFGDAEDDGFVEVASGTVRASPATYAWPP